MVLSGQYSSNNFLSYKSANEIVSTTLYPEVIKIFFCPKSELGEERRRSGVSVVSGPTSNIDTAQTSLQSTSYHPVLPHGVLRKGGDNHHPLQTLILSSLAKYLLSATVLRIQILYLYI